MGVLRAIGYFFASVLLIMGILLFPFGIVIIILAIIWMWALHKGGQVTKMQKDLAYMRKMQQYYAEKAIDDRIREEREKRNFNIRQGWE
jgi:predicted membrane protein